MDKQTLAKLVEEKANKLIEDAHSTGTIDPLALQELQSLTKLAEIEKSGKPAKAPPHWRLVAAGALTLALCSFLMFHRISSADITLDARVSQLSFVTGGSSAPALLNESWALSSLGVERATELNAPTTDSVNTKLQLSRDSAYARLTAQSDPKTPGRILLNGLTLEPGTHVDLLRRNTENEYELRLTPPAEHSISIKATVQGKIEAAYPEAAAKTMTFDQPQQVIASATNEPLVLAVKPASFPFEFARNIPITDVRLFELQEYADPGQNLLREVSSIENATLYLESINGEKKDLRTGEDLHFHNLTGLLRSAELDLPAAGGGNPTIGLQLSGSVSDMTIGHDASPRSLMPTTLEWLSKRQGLTLFWGTSLYAIGLITTFWTWWNKRD